MDNDTLSSPHSSAITGGALSLQQLPPSSCPCEPSRQYGRRRRCRPRPQRSVAVGGFTTVMLYAGLAAAATLSYYPTPSHAMMENNRQQQQPHGTTTNTALRRLNRDGLTTRATFTGACNSDQHTFLFTLYTDANSITDNSWTMSHASYGRGHETGNTGTFIAEESLGSGKLGYGAVVTHTICADKAPLLSTADANDQHTIESCYDLELNDSNGDGLTAPWAAQGGLAGGFSFSIDGKIAVEHRGQACLFDNSDEWNECAVQNGFEYCGVRVCTVNDRGASKAIISSLSGSQCSLAQPQCDASSVLATSESSISVAVTTDSYAEEFSWELRRSTKAGSKSMDSAWMNDLLLAGGKPVYEEGSTENIVLGQRGVGAPVDDNESYESKACLDDNQSFDTCYDFRAYDAYGDGMGCGADGTLSITLQTEQGRLLLEQEDTDMAKRQNADGQIQLACMNRKRLSKWSLCAVRICSDGQVFGLQGNQCDFGLGDILIDEAYLEQDPISGLTITPQNSVVEEEDKGNEVVMIEHNDLGLVVIVDTDNDITANAAAVDETWAEYYEKLGPGFTLDTSNASMETNNAEFIPTQAKPEKNQNGQEESESTLRPNAVQLDNNNQGQKGPRPNSGKLDPKPQNSNSNANAQQQQGQERPRPNFGNLDPKPQNSQNSNANAQQQQGQKGPRPNSGKDPKPQNSQNSNANAQQQQGQEEERTAPLKRFSTDLLSVQFPYPLVHNRASQMSDEVSDFLVSYFANKNNRNGIEDEPIKFELDCTKVQKNVGQENRWVMNCEGNAVFLTSSSASLPTKKFMNTIIRDAFLGDSKEQFLERMYDYDVDTDTKKNKKQMKKEKLEARKEKLEQRQDEKEEKLQQKQGVVNIVQSSMDQKKLTKLEKKQMKMEKLEAKMEKLEDRKEKQQQMQQKNQQLNQQEQQGGENVMGYVSGLMSEMSDSDKGFAILGGNIHVYVDGDKISGAREYGDKEGGRRHKRMLRSSGLNGSGVSS